MLPTILIAAALATALGGALVSAAFHTTRGARRAWIGERTLHAADAALAQATLQWTPARIARVAVGAREQEQHTTADGVTVRTTATRTSPFTLLLDAIATTDGTSATVTRRHLSRVLYLDAAAVPLRAALTTLGTLDITPASPDIVSGTNTNDETSCGLTSDTASTAALLTLPPLLLDSSAFTGAPAIRYTSVDSASAFRTTLWQRIATLTLSPELTTGTTSITPVTVGTSCSGLSGEPRRGITAVAPCITHWPTRRLASNTGTVTLATSRHQGTLVIDGNLAVTGHLELRGLLIVEGTIDSRHGSVDAVGAIIATHHEGGTTTLGNTSRVRWSRCAALRAVTPLATSASPPVLSWLQRW